MKTCNTCARYDVCRSWTQPQYRCGNYLQAPPCKIGDLLFVPIRDEDEGIINPIHPFRWAMLDGDVQLRF